MAVVNPPSAAPTMTIFSRSVAVGRIVSEERFRKARQLLGYVGVCLSVNFYVTAAIERCAQTLR